MMFRPDISQGAYLRLRTTRLGKPAGLIGKVYAVGTDQAGDWYFQLRYLYSPSTTKTKPYSQWSLNLHETDLEHFDKINNGEMQRLLRETGSSMKSAKEILPGLSRHSSQLLLF